jgi:hypothetical protein
MSWNSAFECTREADENRAARLQRAPTRAAKCDEMRVNSRFAA